MRGQLYILAAFFVYLVISQVANVAYYSSLPAQTAYAGIEPAPQIAQTIATEIVYVLNANPRASIADFQQFAGNFSTEKSYATVINSTTGGVVPGSTCDYYANATATTLTSHTDFTVNATSQLGEASAVKNFRVCWK